KHENYQNLSEKDSILLRNKQAADIAAFVDSIVIRQHDYKIDTCYMSDYAIARTLKYTILDILKDYDLDFKLNVLSTYAPIIKSNHVRSQISNYLIKEIVPNSGPKTTLHQELLAGKKEEEAFANLIKPYEGNVLMIDFWNLGCGPCRAGMLKDRDMVERLKDKKIKFLYVTCDVDSPIEHTEKFLNDNNIKGEQIRISKDDWSRISSKLSISGIPHQTLVDKNGEILMNNHKGIEVNEPVLLQLEQQ
ncbi:MAG: TlpA family protein disulfide reductase, partial [Tannerellaceae bacterium]